MKRCEKCLCANVCISGALTIVPIVPWHGAPAEGGPRPPSKFSTACDRHVGYSADLQSVVFSMRWYTLSLLQDAEGAHPRLTLPG